MDKQKLIILGSGPAGLTSAIYAARGDLKPLVIAGIEPGGQLMMTTEVDNFPGFPEGIQGPDLMNKMRAQAERFGAVFVDKNVVSADFSVRGAFIVKTEDDEYVGESIIIATGASSIWLGLPNEKELIGKGISTCATCDGFFFKGKSIAVIGGGDSAMEEATFLTKFASSVTVIHRRDELKASKIMQDKAKSDPKINFLFNTTVEEIIGTDRLEGLKLKNILSGEITEMKFDGMFVAIGHKPNTEIFNGQIELDVKNYIVVKDNTKTNIEGVFVGGDVYDHRYKQAITAAGYGCMAAIDAEKWLTENNK